MSVGGCEKIPDASVSEIQVFVGSGGGLCICASRVRVKTRDGA